MLLTAGERISMALLAMALDDRGVQAISFTGSQCGILTDGGHGAARIVDVRPDRLRAALAAGQDRHRRRLPGRARRRRRSRRWAAAARTRPPWRWPRRSAAPRCEIYTDVAGVFTADPRVVPAARRHPQADYRVCSTLAHRGGRVLHARCVDLAARERVPLVVRSSFDETPGTEIGDADMEGPGWRR